MNKYYVAGVATVDLYDGDQLWAVASTLTDSSMSTSVTIEEIRAGAAAMLCGLYAHSAGMKINFTEAMMKLGYIAKNVGSVIEVGGDAPIQETCTVTQAGQVTVLQTPVKFGENIIGWYRKANSLTDTWTKGDFTGKNMAVAGANIGDTYCVKYFSFNSSAKKLDVKANFVPGTTHAIMHLPLFSGDVNNTNAATLAGEIMIGMKRLQFDGIFEMSMSMTGAASFPFSATALAYEDGANCGANAKLAVITEIILNADWKDSAYALAVDDADITLAVNGTQQMQVYALFPDAQPKLVSANDLTFVSDTQAKATVDNQGVVKGIAAGNANVEVTLTGKTISAIAKVTVS